MMRWLCFWALFAVLLLVAWRLAGMLMDMVLLAVIVTALVVCRRCHLKEKHNIVQEASTGAFDRVFFSLLYCGLFYSPRL